MNEYTNIKQQHHPFIPGPDFIIFVYIVVM